MMMMMTMSCALTYYYDVGSPGHDMVSRHFSGISKWQNSECESFKWQNGECAT
jgi:hypothetical protein